MRLLVSVVDAGEARAAAAAGADIVDVKNPAEGSLGAPSPAVIADVRAAVPAELPVSAAIGDMPNLPGTAALAALGAAHSGATFVKVGLWGASTRGRRGRPAARRARRPRPSAVVVAGAYADARRVPHRAARARAAAARRARRRRRRVPARHGRQGRPRAPGLALAGGAHGAGGRGPRAGAGGGAGRRAARARTCRSWARPAPTSSASARPHARVGGAPARSTRRGSVPCGLRTRLRRARLGEPGDVQPVCARACAALADGGGDGVTPGRGGRRAARDQVIDALLRGLGLDQAAQAEADVPALVALDRAPHPRAPRAVRRRPGPRAARSSRR